MFYRNYSGDANKLTGLRYAEISDFKFGPNGLEVNIIPGTEKVEEGDFIIYALGQKVDIPAEFGLQLNKFGFPTVDEGTHKASDQNGVFLAGDVITGTKSVIEAIAGAREAAIECDLYLGGDGNINETLWDRDPVDPCIGKIEGFASIPRQEPAVETIEKRARSFTMVDLGLNEEQALCEASRCLQCDLRCDIQRTKLWAEY